jgi:Mg-chelatase subunit ChlD
MDHLRKWRLILGPKADPDGQYELPEQLRGMDNTLDALYDSERRGGLGPSSPNVNRWLGDIRKYFPKSVVQLLQRDALERLELDRMLLEPELLESIEPDVHLVGALLSLNKILPDESRETARLVVRKLVEQIERELRFPLEQAVRGRLKRATRTRRPRPGDIDWRRTIAANLKHYQPDYKTILPIELRGHARRRRQLKHVILLLDQSGSMASSVVYAGVLGCILASLPALRTTVIAFDTSVVDLSRHLNDPVDLLFATQLGGGTDIARALAYAQPLITAPADTTVFLLSDLFEGGSRTEMLRRCLAIKQSGARLVPLLALSDEGTPVYDQEIAGELRAMDLQPAACTPDAFPELLARAL